MDYLEEARRVIREIVKANLEPAEIQADSQFAIACALVAQTVRLDALIERLDMLTEFDGGKALFVALTK